MAKNAKTNPRADFFGGVSKLPEQPAQDTHNAHDTHSTHNAQRKQKHPRINMAFYDDNLGYVREAAYQSRMSVTEYVNKLIVEDKERRRLHQQERTIQTPTGVVEQMDIDDVK